MKVDIWIGGKSVRKTLSADCGDLVPRGLFNTISRGNSNRIEHINFEAFRSSIFMIAILWIVLLHLVCESLLIESRNKEIRTIL